MRREHEIKVRLNDEEFKLLNDKVIDSGYSRERYIRTLIGGAVSKERPPIEYHKLINEFNRIGVNLNQLTRITYYDEVKIELEGVLKELKSLMKDLENQIRLPEKM